MSIHASVAVLKKDGSVDSIYVHSDGYLDGVGKMLEKHYNTFKKAIALVDLGDLSAVYPRVNPDEGEKHSFDNPAKGVTIAYHRDRNEELRHNKYKSLEDYKRNRDSQSYDYLFKDGEWYHVDGSSLLPLKGAKSFSGGGIISKILGRK